MSAVEPTRVPDVPALGSDVPPWARGILGALREAVQVREGRRGHSIDAAVTFRDLIDSGMLTLTGAPGILSRVGVPDVAPTVGPTAPLDTTPPPAATNLIVTPGFATFFVSWDASAYTQGGGHAFTEVWGATYTTGPLPTFGNALLLDRVNANLYAYPGGLSRQMHFWLRNVSRANVPQVSPTGGTNGVSATTGLVGNTDLGPLIVQAGNLASGAVTAEKAALDIGGENLLANNSFEVDADASGVADGWASYNNSAGTEPSTMTRPAGRITGLAQRNAWTGTNTTTKGVFASSSLGGGVRGAWQANQTYVVSWYARADTAKASGTQLVWNTAPATSAAIKNPNLSTAWQRYAYRIAWGASVQANAELYLSIISGAALTGYVEFDDVQVELGDTLSGFFGKLATNTIVAGDGAIANLAITNALVANAAIDDAKIANLSAVKITAGTLDAARIAAGSLNADKITAGTVTADRMTANLMQSDNVLTRGLTVRDAAGNVILSSGQNLDVNRLAQAADFSPVLTYDFNNSDGGWAPGGATLTTQANYVTLTSTGADPMFTSPTVSLNGARFDKVRARVRRTAGSAWDGKLYYQTGGHGFSELFKKTLADTTVLNQWVLLEWDMAALTDGGTDWITNTILSFRIDLGSSSSDVFDIDWIAVGRYGPAQLGELGYTGDLNASSGNTLNNDPNVKTISEWSYGTIVTIADGITGSTVLRSTDNGVSNHIYSIRSVPLDRTKSYRLSCLVRRQLSAVNGTFYLGLMGYTSNGTADYGLSPPYTHYNAPVSGLSTSFERRSVLIDASVMAGLNASLVRIGPHLILGFTGAPNNMGGYVEVQDVRMEEVATFGSTIGGQITSGNASTFIANAAIGAAHIGSLNADVITTGSMNAARITAGTITTDRIVVGAVTASAAASTSNAVIALLGGVATTNDINLVSITKVINGSTVRLHIKGTLAVVTKSAFSGGSTSGGSHDLALIYRIRGMNGTTEVTATFRLEEYRLNHHFDGNMSFVFPVDAELVETGVTYTGTFTAQLRLTTLQLQTRLYPGVSGGVAIDAISSALLSYRASVQEIKV